jgi:hypothetical protein
MNPVLILTTTVHVQYKIFLFQMDPNDRIAVYVKKIRQWLEHTKLPIIVVENTGYTFPELDTEREVYKDRFEIITYQESELPESAFLHGNIYKGASEIFAIDWAKRTSRLSGSFYIKITGRYYIPDLESFLQSVPLEETDVLIQNQPDRCELVGCHKDVFDVIFNTHLLNRDGNYDGHVELIYEQRCQQFSRVVQCPRFVIEPTQRGGVNEIFYDI